MSKIEQTLSIIKPDAVERNLEDQIKKIFTDNGFKIFKSKKIQLEKPEAEKFYKISPTVFLGGSIVSKGGQNPLELKRILSSF